MFSEACGVGRGLQCSDLWTVQLYLLSVKDICMYIYWYLGNKENLKGTQNFVIHAC